MDEGSIIQSFTGTGPAILLGLAVLILVVVSLRQMAAIKGYRNTLSRLGSDAEISHEILATAPDGLFLWVALNGTQACSRRLAVMLGLENGVRSGFDEVLTRFSENDAAILNSACVQLRQRGDQFEMMLTTKDGMRRLLVVGVRAGTADGTALADILWMRDISDLAPPGEASKATSREVIEALPFPAWLRGSGLALQIANARAQALSAPDVSRELAEQARRDGTGANERHLLTMSDGKPRLVDISEIPLSGGGTLGVAQDHTHTEEMEVDYTRHIQAQNHVMESLATAISIFDGNGKLSFFNSAYSQLWDLSPEWLQNEPTLGAVLDRMRDKRKLPEVADYKAFKAGQLGLFGTLSSPLEEMLHLPDGTTLRSVVGPHPLGGLVFAFEDVTDHLDLERSYRTLSLVQSETIDNLYEAVAVFGGDGRIKLFNPAFQRTWKLQDSEKTSDMHLGDFIDHMLPLIDSHSGKEYQNHESLTASLMSSGNLRGRIELKDGTALEFAKVGLPDGAALLSYLDVTDSTRIEEALTERARSMAETNLLKSEFLAGVANEIRTPLNAIIGFSAILSEEYFGKLSERQKEYSRGILDSAEELVSVIEGTLDLATVEAGLMTIELDTVDVKTLLGNVLGLVRERARQRNIKIEFDCPADIGWLVADEKRLKQSLYNLISIAIHSTPPGGKVAILITRNENDMAFEITDGGPGVADYDVPPGVALVTRFIELHGGTVVIQARPGKGTSITCRLPIDAPALEPAPQPDLFSPTSE